jgi:hypothetical protein
MIEGSAQSSTHYQKGRLQPIEIMQDHLTREEFIGYLKGNILKYTMRCGYKDDVKKECAKIEQYAKWLYQAQRGMLIDPNKVNA